MEEEMDVNQANGENVVQVEKGNFQKGAVSQWIFSKLEQYQRKKAWHQEDHEVHMSYFKRKHALKLKSMKKRHTYQLRLEQRKKHELKLKQIAEKHYLILNYNQYLKLNEKRHESRLKYLDEKIEVLIDLAEIVSKLPNA